MSACKDIESLDAASFLDCYQDDGSLTLNNIEVKMGDVALISELRVVLHVFQQIASIDEPTFEERIFLGVKMVSYQETNKSSFWRSFTKRVARGTRGLICPT